LSIAVGDRHPWSPSRRAFTAAFILLGAGLGLLTGLGFADRPRQSQPATSAPSEHEVVAMDVFNTVCFACHKLKGTGGTVGPDLSHVGRSRNAATIRKIIEDPLNAFDDSEMPPFEKRLSSDQLNALAQYLASLK
jgi:mono/diheme cytochrome c family protein